MNNQIAEGFKSDIANDRPLVTFALFAYNQEKYIREAVEGAFSQTYEPLEIILSDDFSGDRTFEIMKEMAATYRGTHEVRVRQSRANNGLAAHFNDVLVDAKGAYFVVAAGDDISISNRCSLSVAPFLDDLNLSFLDTAVSEINENSEKIKIDKQELISRDVKLKYFLRRKEDGLIGASRTYRRATLLRFPPLNLDCPTEDSTNVLRCLMSGPAKFLAVKTVYRRIHENNLSGVASLRLMKLNTILAQYLADTDYAVKYGIISVKQSKLIRRWAIETIFRRTLSQSIQNGESLNFTSIIKTMTTSNIGFRIRISSLFMIIRSWMI